jgi:hypothetical protein
MTQYTSYADRQEMIAFHQQGYSYGQIVQRTGWSFETVRKICRGYKREGDKGIQFQRLGRPTAGPLSTFDPLVRWASLRIKCHHPGWGPEVVRAELATRSWSQGVRLPSVSQIGVYFSQFGERLVVVRAHTQLPQAEPLAPVLRIVHGCWQMDADERVVLPGYGEAHILNLVDYASGLKIDSRLFPAHTNGHRCRITWPQLRQALRTAFSKWGLPHRIRTDRDRVIVTPGNYPFPMPFTLWLVGLDIEHELIRRVTENGSVERAHRTWEGRLSGYGPYPHLEQWQQMIDYELWRMNVVLPSRGRHCHRHPPLLVYPQARYPLRYFRAQDELALFDLERIHRYLTNGKWLRYISSQGQLSFNDQKFYVGLTYQRRWVQITYLDDPDFQVTCPPDDTAIKIIQVKGLTRFDMTDISEGV